MIDYSVFLMKSTITPEAKPKAFAKLQVKETWDIDRFAKYVAMHSGVYNHGIVKGLVSEISDCIVELLLEGMRINLGKLGTFGASVNCRGAESVESFKKKDIKSLNVIFTPGSDLQNLVDRAEFNLVASRTIQNSVLKEMQREESYVESNK